MSPSNRGGEQVVTLGEIVLIHDLKRQGLSVSAIARKVGLDRKTVRRHLARGLAPPSYGPRLPRPSRLAPYEAYLRERIDAPPTHAEGGDDDDELPKDLSHITSGCRRSVFRRHASSAARRRPGSPVVDKVRAARP